MNIGNNIVKLDIIFRAFSTDRRASGREPAACLVPAVQNVSTQA